MDGSEYGLIRRQRRKPLIAAVEGAAVGGGFEIVLACDLVVSAENAEFALPEVKRGVAAVCGAFFRAPEKLPANIAVEKLLTGAPISAVRAHHFGLVNLLAEPGDVVATAMTLARKIARNSPLAVQYTLEALMRARADAESAGWAHSDRASELVQRAPDRLEGIAAFFEGREPRWNG
jgi:enoyl-CoA hydratase